MESRIGSGLAQAYPHCLPPQEPASKTASLQPSSVRRSTICGQLKKHFNMPGVSRRGGRVTISQAAVNFLQISRKNANFDRMVGQASKSLLDKLWFPNS
jgi:hypothetical protein